MKTEKQRRNKQNKDAFVVKCMNGFHDEKKKDFPPIKCFPIFSVSYILGGMRGCIVCLQLNKISLCQQRHTPDPVIFIVQEFYINWLHMK